MLALIIERKRLKIWKTLLNNNLIEVKVTLKSNKRQEVKNYDQESLSLITLKVYFTIVWK